MARRVGYSLIAGTLILAEVGVSVAPIVGAAAVVVGLAVAFGAQSLIKDYFNGFFILIENQIRQGDVVDRLADSAVVIRCRFEVKPLEQWNVKRQFLRQLKYAFDREGIEIPYPRVTLYAGALKNGAAPAFHLATRGEMHDPRSQPDPGGTHARGVN